MSTLQKTLTHLEMSFYIAWIYLLSKLYKNFIHILYSPSLSCSTWRLKSLPSRYLYIFEFCIFFMFFVCLQFPLHIVTELSCYLLYRVSHNWVLTLFCLFSQLPELVQTFILPFYNSPGDVDSKTHLTFHPMSKIDQVTEQNVRQTEFRYYFFGTYKVYLHYI